MSLNYQIKKEDDWELVTLSGHINEDAETSLAEMLDKLAEKCVLNLKNVESVNSLGVRAWINFIREVEKNRSIVFEECTPEIIGQINMIPNFKGQAHIRSLYGSYVCESCGHEKLVLFKEGDNMPDSPEADIDDVTCDKCSETMEMEELEEEFFSWLES